MPRAFWSGTISFGLVSVPVEIYAANRGRPVSLRMLSPEGRPLSRRYYCPRDERYLDRDEIVRGYEIDGGSYVTVEDEELDALAPEKSREIDLRHFVDRSELPDFLYDRGYFLVPSSETTKAYRLLASVMERTEKAGVATFVMRGREYLVAILAEGGILRAATLRFHDEIRSPSDVGMPDRSEPEAERTGTIGDAVEELSADGLDRGALTDEWAEEVQELAREKRERGEDVIEVEAPDEPEEEAAEEDQDGAEVIDMMDFLKERLGGEDGGATEQGEAGTPLAERTRDELYEIAREKDIEGRSSMKKDELVEALRSAG